ncbi:hypothetical protein THICB6_260029 [Thiomonas arsenitoxydans]|nr:hypothetical protein THICB6_260029 [Thiomonas arsenitoxydans]
MVMLRFLLDTNICIYLMKEQPEPVIRRFSACKPGEVGVSSITWAELCCGLEVHNSPPELTALSNSLVIKDFDVQAAAFFGNLKIWLLVGRPANQDAMSLSTRCGPGSAKQHQRC